MLVCVVFTFFSRFPKKKAQGFADAPAHAWGFATCLLADTPPVMAVHRLQSLPTTSASVAVLSCAGDDGGGLGGGAGGDGLGPL